MENKEKIDNEEDKILEVDELSNVYTPDKSSEVDNSKIIEIKDIVDDKIDPTEPDEIIEIEDLEKQLPHNRESGEENKIEDILNKGKEIKENREEVEFIINEIEGWLEDLRLAKDDKNKGKGLLAKLGISKKTEGLSESYRKVLVEGNSIFSQLDFLEKNKVEITEDQQKIIDTFNDLFNKERESLSKDIKKSIKDESEKVEEEIEKILPEHKKFFESAKKFLGNKRVQFVIGAVIIGLAVAAPPTGALSFYTFGLLPGVLPASAATGATALTGAAGGLLISREVIEGFFKKAEAGEIIKISEPEVIIKKEEVPEEVVPEEEAPEEEAPEEVPEEVSLKKEKDDEIEEMFDRPVASEQYQQAMREMEEVEEKEEVEKETSSEKDYFKLIQEGIDNKDPLEVGLKDKRTGRADSWNWKAVEVIKSINNQPDKIRIEKKSINGGVSLKLVDLNDLLFKKSDEFRA
ncbi:MAG: hypothetical protein PHX92_00315 [Candidatus Pacebacteria bacterium]|nr:hypothetical protein [Candidatus Paceibacterota bacterium]